MIQEKRKETMCVSYSFMLRGTKMFNRAILLESIYLEKFKSNTLSLDYRSKVRLVNILNNNILNEVIESS